MEKNREGPKGFRPGPDNNQIVERLIAITAKDENHAKVRRRKDGCLIISAVSEAGELASAKDQTGSTASVPADGNGAAGPVFFDRHHPAMTAG